jgi:exosortase F-associated protein
MAKVSTKRWLAGAIGFFGLIAVYVLQNQLFYDPLKGYPMIAGKLPDDFDGFTYAYQKVIRYLLNDGFALALIYAIFEERKYVQFAVYVFLFGLLFLLPTYLVLFVYFSEETYTYLNHLHRLVLNPVLMMLLIPAFFYQKRMRQRA